MDSNPFICAQLPLSAYSMGYKEELTDYLASVFVNEHTN
ncbi:hypothetical protein ALTERO38_50850 [Alteromonas sp. 38]|nr:hypothetical protein ALTER154_70031 [Alteromonas sp. 154]VXB50682.1 hypothetical protein ALTERO38_50850 [Alteromonas sp. 38]